MPVFRKAGAWQRGVLGYRAVCPIEGPELKDALPKAVTSNFLPTLGTCGMRNAECSDAGASVTGLLSSLSNRRA